MTGMDHPMDGWWAAHATDQHVNLLPGGAQWTDAEVLEQQPSGRERSLAA
jgi:hypothetical protein